MPSHNRAILADINKFGLNPAIAHSKIKASGHLAPLKQVSVETIELMTATELVVSEVVELEPVIIEEIEAIVNVCQVEEIVEPVITIKPSVVNEPDLEQKKPVLPKTKKSLFKKKEKKEPESN